MTTRRDFIKLSLIAGSALAIGFDFDAHAEEAPFTPNAWIRIDPDGTITLTAGKSEMGQGVRTSLPMILADELDADWSSIRVVQASPSETFQRLGTGGSFSVRGSWTPLRQAGAAARAMLLSAAAARLSVDRTTLRTERGFVIHDPSNRRIAYGELTTAAAALPLPADAPLKSKFSIVGTRTKRVDAPAIVTGKAKYGIDTRVEKMLHATIARPPVFGGTVKRFDGTRAKAVKGVKHVVAVKSGVAVVADSTWAAMKGREALEIEFDDGPNAAFNSALHAQRMREAAPEAGFITRHDGAPIAAAKTIVADYDYPFYAHAPMEPMNCVADFRGTTCELWSPTQAPNAAQERVAEFLGIPKNSVQVNVTLIGGGFGRRLWWDYDLEAADVSRAIGGGPVQVLWSRQDDLHHGYFQAAALHRLSGGFDADGKLVSWTHKKVSSPHNARRKPTAEQLRDPNFYQGSSWGVYDVPYDIPFIETSYVRVDGPVPIGPWRAVFSPSSTFARECFFDELAEAAGADPLQFRLDHLGGPEKITAGDVTIDRTRLRRVLETLRAKSDWGKPMPKGSGRGMACNVHDGETHVAYAAEVAVRDGRVRVQRIVGVVDCGVVVNPLGVEAQMESGIAWSLSSALKDAITFDQGRAEQTNFDGFDVLRLDEMPKVEIHIMPSNGTEPFGMGEPSVPPVIPAVVNAIHAATGKRLRKLPIRPEDFA